MKTMVKKTFTLLFAALPLVAAAQTETAPAFPGAEGHGRYTTGGRGGKVIHVTNLNDSGTGSLRAALSGTGKKIIVFDVGGYIDLKSNLPIPSNTTILGQTAPAPGITLRYYTLEFTKGDNIICRFIRSRRSQVKDINDGADAAWGRNRKNIILDHCSFSWSIDEVGSFYDNRDFTMQWCTLGEGLREPGHSKGAHSYGGIWGGKNASFHHNFIAHVDNRVPRFNGARYNWTGYDKTKYANSIQAERVDFRNCVMYNWGNGGCYGGPGGGYVNMVNNYYKAGPGTKNKTRVTQVSKADAGNSGSNPFPNYTSRYYIHGNYVAAASSPENYDWKGVAYDSGIPTINGERYSNDPEHRYGAGETYVTYNGVDHIKIKLDSPIDAGEVTTHDAKVAYEKVVGYGGASLHRDAVDARYMDETREGSITYTGKISNILGILDVINDPSKEADPTTASFPELESTSRPADFDTDKDGIPDAWEIANGLNPNDASDASATTIDTRGWYTNIEVYANSLVEHIMKGGNSDAIDAVNEYYPAFVSTGIDGTTVGDKEVVATMYHNLQGQRIDANAKGVKIKTVILKNNQRISTKVID